MEKFKALFLYETLALAKGRWIWIYLLAFNLILFFLRYFSNDLTQLMMSTLNAVIYFHSIGVLLFSTLSWQNNSEFISLILTQPVGRDTVFFARLTSFCIFLALSTGVSLVIQMSTSFSLNESLLLLAIQTCIELVFTGLGFFLAIQVQDRLKAMAIASIFILCFTVILDGFNLWVIVNFSAYPLEKIILGLSCINPLSLMKFLALNDASNPLWMGYSGVILHRAWESGLIKVVAVASIILWVLAPIISSLLVFKRKDF